MLFCFVDQKCCLAPMMIVVDCRRSLIRLCCCIRTLDDIVDGIVAADSIDTAAEAG